MQASKVKLNSDYAVKHDGKTVAFRVTAIRTTRSTRGTSNAIIGFIVDDAGVGDIRETKTYDVEDLLGPFEEFAELVKARNAEKAEQARIAKARDDAAHDLVRTFYRLTGQPVPNKLDDYKNLFRRSYSGSVEIDREGVALLLAALTKQKEVA